MRHLRHVSLVVLFLATCIVLLAEAPITPPPGEGGPSAPDEARPWPDAGFETVRTATQSREAEAHEQGG